MSEALILTDVRGVGAAPHRPDHAEPTKQMNR